MRLGLKALGVMLLVGSLSGSILGAPTKEVKKEPLETMQKVILSEDQTSITLPTGEVYTTNDLISYKNDGHILTVSGDGTYVDEDGTQYMPETTIWVTLSEDKKEITMPNGDTYTTLDGKDYTLEGRVLTYVEDGLYMDKDAICYRVSPNLEGTNALKVWPTLVEVIGRNGLMHFDTDQIPFIKDTRTLVPLKHIVDSFGARADISPQDKSITVKAKDKTLIFNIDSATYTVNGVEQTMDTAPYVSNNRVYVPVRYAFEVFEQPIVWNVKSSSVYADIDVLAIADYINYNYKTSVGGVSCRNKYPSGLQVVPGELSKQKTGSVIELYIPYAETEALAQDVDYVLSGLDLKGKENLLQYIFQVGTKTEKWDIEDTSYTFTRHANAGVYVTIHVDNATSDKMSVQIAGVEGDLSLINDTAYGQKDTCYVELLEVCNVLGVNLTSSVYANILTFDNDSIVDVCEKKLTKNGVEQELGGSIFITENRIYIDVNAANNLFGCNLTWESLEEKLPLVD